MIAIAKAMTDEKIKATAEYDVREPLRPAVNSLEEIRIIRQPRAGAARALFRRKPRNKEE
jgi:hypothetical protein